MGQRLRLSSGISLGASFNTEMVLLGQSADVTFDAAEPTEYQHNVAGYCLR
jgi:hypothetical protein